MEKISIGTLAGLLAVALLIPATSRADEKDKMKGDSDASFVETHGRGGAQASLSAVDARGAGAKSAKTSLSPATTTQAKEKTEVPVGKDAAQTQADITIQKCANRGKVVGGIVVGGAGLAAGIVIMKNPLFALLYATIGYAVGGDMGQAVGRDIGKAITGGK